MIKLASFRPEYFDNNGDQANLSVLIAHLTAVSVDFEVTQELVGSDFLLVGDSSIAAHNHFQAELMTLVPELKMRLMAGKPTLLVGRSYEFFAPLLGIELTHGERESKFVKIRVAHHEVVGYHNSAVLEPRFFISGAFVGTTLFGPVLAKNPSVLGAIGQALGAEFKGEFFERSEQLANLVRDATTF